MARGKMASVENRWQMKAPPSSFLHPWHIASPPDLGSSPESLLCIWQRKIRLDLDIISQEVGPALLISIILINQTSKIHPNALWQSCNGEMDIGFFSIFRRKQRSQIFYPIQLSPHDVFSHFSTSNFVTSFCIYPSSSWESESPRYLVTARVGKNEVKY